MIEEDGGFYKQGYCLKPLSIFPLHVSHFWLLCFCRRTFLSQKNE